MALRHLVCIRFHPGTPPAAVEAMARGLERLPSVIPEIAAYLVGPDLGIADTSWDFGISADFASVADFEAYRAHPDHVAVLRDLIEPIAEQRVSVQLAR
jgi:hypothetical protein